MEHQKPRRAALYARVSTAEQHTDGQIERLREVARLRGWTVATEHVEVVSGAAKTRPEFDRMMVDVRRRRVDVVAAVDLTALGGPPSA
jgi:DNA invertase Pin-like site-specific DNA recombinase